MSREPSWRRTIAIYGLVWLALVALLGLTVWAAFIPLGAFNTPVSLAIAAVKAVLVVTIFMKLDTASGLVRLAALAGLLFVAVMFALTLADVVTRG